MESYELKETLVTVDNVSLQSSDLNGDVDNNKLILKPINAEVKDIVRPNVVQGQVVGILGPSGVGKSQFSRILSGLQKPTTGEVKILKGDKLVPVEAGDIGVVFQNYPLFKHRTVLGNLLVALESTKLSKAERKDKAMDYLRRFDLVERANFYPAQLSGGQKQRVSIIQELLNSSYFLLMDEPFTGLDPISKDKVCELIDKVATMDEKNTIFVIAHDISALVSIADSLWLLGRDRDENGNIVPGASIKASYNLIERDLAWHPSISSTTQFHAFVNEVKEQFRAL